MCLLLYLTVELTDIIIVMRKKIKECRESKVSKAKDFINSGFYDEFIQDIADFIISGNTYQSKKLHKTIDFYSEIPKETKIRVNLSFYAAIISMFFGFVLLGSGLFLAWERNLLAGSLIASIGGTISGFITKTFLKIHQISLDQLNRFYIPVLKEILSEIEKIVECLQDSKLKEQARISMIDALLSILKKGKLDFDT